MSIQSTFLILISLIIKFNSVYNNSNYLKDDIQALSDIDISMVSRLSDQDHFRETLDNILIPRIVGTEGHKKVRDFIIKSMEELSWQVDLDIFEDETPNMGKLKFQNVIATQNPSAKRFIILACHYDSKYIEGEEFLGATDSAVPCAMLINLAKVLNDKLQKKQNYDVSLMFVFFDGEEAFSKWSPTDSIYGAKHLANKWNSSGFIKQIDMLVLLDLIGAPNPKFYSFFTETEDWFAQMITIENRMLQNGLLENYTTSGTIRSYPNRFFQPSSSRSFIEDDHVPFMKLGVPILHLISYPFPDVWHKPDDNLEAVDFRTVENISKILRGFIVQYLRIGIENS